MALLSQDALQRLQTVVNVSKKVFHIGFIPTVLYLGIQKGPNPGMPEFNLFNTIFW